MRKDVFLLVSEFVWPVYKSAWNFSSRKLQFINFVRMKTHGYGQNTSTRFCLKCLETLDFII